VTTFVQLLFAGVALGAIYALVALGFTVVYRSSRVINFAQGALLALGAFVTSWLVLTENLPFWAAFIVGALITGGVGLVFQLWVVRFAIGRPEFTIVMLTLGLAAVIGAVLPTLFGNNPRSNGDVWGSSAVHVGHFEFFWVQVWTIVAAITVLLVYGAFTRYTRYGLAMRSAALDPEAAMAVGIPLRRVYATAWFIAAAVACIGGVFLGGYPNSVSPTMSNIALIAFPAIILGGLDSPTGAIVGGFAIGVIQELVQGYQPQHAPWLGNDFYLIAPYLVMILVLLIRPYGLFGSRPAERL
jgi:branched-chain amino acid transport system permease protein